MKANSEFVGAVVAFASFVSMSVVSLWSVSSYLVIPFAQETARHPVASQWWFRPLVAVSLVLLAWEILRRMRRRWVNRCVGGPVVSGTARVLGVTKKFFDDFFLEDAVTYRVEVQVDASGRESFNVMRHKLFGKRPAVGEVYPVELSADDPTRFRVLWDEPMSSLPPPPVAKVGRTSFIATIAPIAVILFMLAVPLYFYGKEHPDNPPDPRTEAIVIEACQGSVKKQLNDPGGVEFSDWAAPHVSDGPNGYAPGSLPYHPKVGDTMYHARGYVSQKNGPGGDAAKRIYDCDAVVAKSGDVQVLAWATDRG